KSSIMFMKIIGITGMIASGKSTVENYIKSLGYEVIDADEVYHWLLSNSGELNRILVDTFGKDILDEFNNINTKLLYNVLNKQADKFELLNSITHPFILTEIKRRINFLSHKYIFISVPLLFESNFDILCDIIIYTKSNYEINISRLMNRDKLTHEEADVKLSKFYSFENIKNKIDFTIDNSNSIENTKKQVDEILKKITSV
ncbi:MAG: dephospho-CoA kinase, partial [Anaeroplasmataceae bacterium]